MINHINNYQLISQYVLCDTTRTCNEKNCKSITLMSCIETCFTLIRMQVCVIINMNRTRFTNEQTIFLSH